MNTQTKQYTPPTPTPAPPKPKVLVQLWDGRQADLNELRNVLNNVITGTPITIKQAIDLRDFLELIVDPALIERNEGNDWPAVTIQTLVTR